jgi:hypothetical protein
MAIDTTRNRLWLLNGVYGGSPRADFWYYTLNADPTDNTWTSVGGSIPTITDDGAMIYSPDDDVLMLFGQRSPSGLWETWVYGPSAGALSAEQTAAGCSAPNTWTELTPSGMPASAYSYFPNAIYDPVHHKVLITGGIYYSGGGVSEGIKKVWDYSIPTQTWTERAPSGMPTENVGQSPEQLITRIGSGAWEGHYLYHQTGHDSTALGAADFIYDANSHTFAELTSVGTGPQRLVYMRWDPSADCVVAWAYGGTQAATVWHGVLS